MTFLERLSLALGRLLGWGFLAIAGMMTFEVVARYGFNAPTIWAHEIAGLLAAVAFVFGGAYCLADRSHMRITVISDRFGPRTKRVVATLSAATGIVYLAGLAYATARMSETALFRFAADGAWDPERSGTSWNTPAPSIVKLALCLGAVLFLLLLVQRLLRLHRED